MENIYKSLKCSLRIWKLRLLRKNICKPIFEACIRVFEGSPIGATKLKPQPAPSSQFLARIRFQPTRPQS